MPKINLLKFKKNLYSQNGEDGIIGKIFSLIGSQNKICCEFGAWDGKHLSNTRHLIEKGWSSIQIEGDKKKFSELKNVYRNNRKVYCLNEYVDNCKNNLSVIFKRHHLIHLLSKIDFLSIDVDGLDLEIFESLDFYPEVICVEVNAGHFPKSPKRLPKRIARNNVGQPLGLFSRLASRKGYKLVCYSGNAFYLKTNHKQINKLSDFEAYQQFLSSLTTEEKEWLYLVNLGKVGPSFKFANPLLRKENLKISFLRAVYLRILNLLRWPIVL